jgi:cytosine/adenosine deaminase-related metal-dependent hydrolase
MPGFIDAHHHLTQSFGKALAFGEPSEIFRRIWVPLEGALDDEFVYLSAKLASLEALRGGFTTVCEAGTRAVGGVDAVAAATRDTGCAACSASSATISAAAARRWTATRSCARPTRISRASPMAA